MACDEQTELERYRDEARRYRLLAEQSTDMISRHSATAEWTYLDVSPAVERILGYSVEEMIGSNGYQLFHPQDADNLKKRAESVRYRSGMYTNTYRYRHKAGHYIWLETTSRTIRDDNGKPVEIICVSRDVTERETAQQAIRRLARVVEAASDMILFCQHESKQLTYLNESAYQTLGTTKKNTDTLYLEQIFEPAVFTTQVQAALQQAARSGIWHGSLALKITTNPHRLAEIREIIAHRNRTEHLQVEYYSLIGRDITLKRRAEEQAKRQQLEMAHMSRLLSVGEMATGLAHEINQPLAAILNYCRGSLRRLEEGNGDNLAQISHSMTLITRQAKRAADIVKRMRSFVKRTDYQRLEFSINAACIEVTGFLNQEAEDHRIRFVFELAPDNPRLLADKIQIEQVLLNLIRNAIEAYNDSNKSDRPVIIASRHDDSYVYVSVKDRAHGISQSELETLFEPFTTSKPTGLGMGLAISQTIIETHGGQLWAQSDGKTVTEFHFKLPLREH